MQGLVLSARLLQPDLAFRELDAAAAASDWPIPYPSVAPATEQSSRRE